jgi:hypothetical protein
MIAKKKHPELRQRHSPAPGTPDRALITALQNRPALLADLLRDVAGLPLEGPLTPLEATTRFARSIVLHMDLLFSAPHKPWILFEIQSTIDETKRQRWLLAASVLCIRERGMGDLVILTASPSVAAWARRVGRQQGTLGTRLVLRPIVILLDRRRIEALISPAHPELALFAAWAMQTRRGNQARQVVERALDLGERLRPAARRDAHARAILAVLSEPMGAHLNAKARNAATFPKSRGLKRIRRLASSHLGADTGLHWNRQKTGVRALQAPPFVPDQHPRPGLKPRAPHTKSSGLP